MIKGPGIAILGCQLSAPNFSSRLPAALRRAILSSDCFDAIQLQLSFYSAINSRRKRLRGKEGIGLNKQSEVALWSKASPLSPSIKHHGVVCRLDSRKPNKLYTRLRYALIETFFLPALEIFLQFFSSLTLAQKASNSLTVLLQIPLRRTPSPCFEIYTQPNLERHGDDCIPYLSPTQLAWLLFFSNTFPSIPLSLFFFFLTQIPTLLFFFFFSCF
ncbi:hypothetical protein GGI43DRAFT_325353 [Trichoderma evansii]